MPQGLYVFIPAYNEQKTLEKVLSDLVALKNKGLIAGICVVNDASGDRTGKIADKFKEQGVEVIHNKRNRGKACCFYQGVKWAHGKKAEYFGMFDADLKEITREDFLKMIETISSSKAKMVIGNTKRLEAIPHRSGQRIIRMSVLKPLWKSKKWKDFILGGPEHRTGYGLESALNYLIGGEPEPDFIYAHSKARRKNKIVLADTHFEELRYPSREGRGSLASEIARIRIAALNRITLNKQKREQRKTRNLSEDTINANKKALKHALRHRPR